MLPRPRLTILPAWLDDRFRIDGRGLGAVAVLSGLIVLLGVVVWSIKRHRDPVLHIECGAPIDELMPSLAGLTLSTAVAGNSVEILENGAFFDVLLEEIRAAQRSVHFEIFLWKEGCSGTAWRMRLPSGHVRGLKSGCWWTRRALRT